MILLNGQVYEPGAPEITLLNRSFKYGDGLFESIRVYQGKALFAEAHLDRLAGGMKYLRFDFDPEPWRQEMKAAILRIIQLNDIKAHGRLRLHVYRAGAGAYLPISNRAYYVLEGFSLKSDFYAADVSISLTDFTEIPLCYSALSGFKTANSLPYILAAQYAVEQGFDEALLFCEGHVSEASAYNVFLVKNRRIYTPPLRSACLNGIMRGEVMRLCADLKIPVKEKRLIPKELLQADEIFLTNTVRGIVPVNQYRDQLMDPRPVMVHFLQKCLLQAVRLKAGV